MLAQDDIEVRCYDHADGWTERCSAGPAATMTVATLGLAVPAQALYAGTGLI